jgi:hypothetical protein
VHDKRESQKIEEGRRVLAELRDKIRRDEKRMMLQEDGLSDSDSDRGNGNGNGGSGNGGGGMGDRRAPIARTAGHGGNMRRLDSDESDSDGPRGGFA